MSLHDIVFERWTTLLTRLTSDATSYDTFLQSLYEDTVSLQSAHELSIPLKQAAAHIDDVVPAMATLEKKLETIRHVLQSLRSQCLSACLIARLPTEILSHIFLLGHHEENADVDDDEIDYIGTVCRTPPLSQTVSHVCHRWREVAIGTKSLWTSIDLSEKSRLFFKRSGNQLLDMKVDLENGGNNVLEVARQYDVRRWASLDVRASDMKFPEQHFGGLFDFHENLPLRRLSITTICGSGATPWVPNAPEPVYDEGLLANLTHLRLYRVFIPWRSTAFVNLTSLKLNGLNSALWPHPGRFSMILRLCPMLDTLEMEEVGIALYDEDEGEWDPAAGKVFGDAGEPNDGDGAYDAVIPLHHLRVLKLAMEDEDSLRYILKRIYAPSLDILSISDDARGHTYGPQRGLTALLTRGDDKSRCHPTRVSFDFLRTSPSEIDAILDLLAPELRKLHLATDEIWDTLAEVLGPARAPHLTVLRLSSFGEGEDDSLVHLVRERASAGRALQQLVIQNNEDSEVLVVEELEKYVREVYVLEE